MGYKLFQDGNCYVCKKHTEHFCDVCLRYICDDHKIEVEVHNEMYPYIMCKECYEKWKKGKAKMIKPRYAKSLIRATEC